MLGTDSEWKKETPFMRLRVFSPDEDGQRLVKTALQGGTDIYIEGDTQHSKRKAIQFAREAALRILSDCEHLEAELEGKAT